MKIRIKTFNGFLVPYLSVGKEYEVLNMFNYDGVDYFNIITDSGNMASVSHHDLYGGSWEIINEG